ncbi:class Ib ribonucleoside-diphosphate reductase assembly flavoprotein NrdI [Lysinibacillus xylanilyticus]|uniref:class Ib ribonucleoside-diphosphate reductase assembly flavoprotein NrdI n=1 Tax=Lysinibacillus xylanilyticus TaxID=582475 RepID=UPI00382C7268
MIVFTSRTGNINDIVGRLDKSIPIVELNPKEIIETPFFLFTYTDGLGNTPDHVKDFLRLQGNRKYLKGVIASGNTNFGMQNFCGTANEISAWFGVPIIRKIDLRGNSNDVIAIEREYKKIIEGEID